MWGSMSTQGLAELHVVPQKQTVNTEYYVSEILTKTLLPALHRSSGNGPILECKMVPGMSEQIFIQDGAPAHTSKKNQEGCRLNFPGLARVAGEVPRPEPGGKSPGDSSAKARQRGAVHQHRAVDRMAKVGVGQHPQGHAGASGVKLAKPDVKVYGSAR